MQRWYFQIRQKLKISINSTVYFILICYTYFYYNCYSSTYLMTVSKRKLLVSTNIFHPLVHLNNTAINSQMILSWHEGKQLSFFAPSPYPDHASFQKNPPLLCSLQGQDRIQENKLLPQMLFYCISPIEHMTVCCSYHQSTVGGYACHSTQECKSQYPT